MNGIPLEVSVTVAVAVIGLCGTFLAAIFTFLGIVYTTAWGRNKNHAETLQALSEVRLNKEKVEELTSNRILVYANELEGQLKILRAEVAELRAKQSLLEKENEGLKKETETLRAENMVLRQRILELEKAKGPQ